ncbi:hypothetical protein T439DRAFT_329493 [Meredithblackwellia eburnea MCA 4105]
MSDKAVHPLRGPASESDINTYLENAKPSLNKDNVEFGQWYWAYSEAKSEDAKEEKAEQDKDKLLEEGKKLEDILLKECERIKAEEPVRENKKSGKRSQKQWREDAYKTFNEGVKDLAKECNILSGKWLFFPGPESVDATWSKVVHSLTSADGALHKHAKCNVAKVAANTHNPEAGGGSADHPIYCICVYVDDSWDKKAVGEVFEILVKELKLHSQSYKCDANTILGIDSKHKSGIPSSLWKATDIMSKAELDELKNAKKEESTKKFNENAKVAAKKTSAEDEVDGFDEVSSSEDEGPKKKKAKK